MASNDRHAQDNQHAHKLRNVLSIASLSAAMSDDGGRAARSSIHARLLGSASGVALSVAAVAVALGVCVPGAAQAQTTVNPVQTTTFALTPAQNPIIFGPTTNIDTTAGTVAVNGDINTAWTVTNNGTLIGGNIGVFLAGAGSSLTNTKSISGTTDNGVQLLDGGTVINQVSGTISGKLQGIKVGSASNQAGNVTNAGTITGLDPSFSDGILLLSGGTVTNQAGGTISGAVGIEVFAAGTVSNAGTITGNTDAINLGKGGTVNNQAGGVISGSTGIVIGGFAGTVTNAGEITGTGGISVLFDGTGTNTLTLQTGSVLNGDAIGSFRAGAANNLILEGHGTANNLFQNFDVLDVRASGGPWVWNSDSTIGSTTITSGTLAVDNTLTSPIVINSGATLAGKGTVFGDVTANLGAAVAPGAIAAFSTLKVSGSVGFAPGSFFKVNVNAAGQSDLLSLVNGPASKANLSGGTVNVLAQNGTYQPSTQYLILSASGGLGGTTFSGVTSNLAFLTPTLSYDPNNVFLTLTCNLGINCSGGGTGASGTGGGGFATVAQTQNQTAVATALNGGAVSNPLVIAILNQTIDGARQAFDALSSEVFGSVHNMQAGETQFARSAMLGRLRQASYAGYVGELGALSFGGPELAYAGGNANAAYAADIRSAVPGKAPMRTGERSRDLTFWAQGLGGWGHTDSDGNAASVKSRFGGFLSGVDARFGETLRAGFVAGYMRSDLNADARASSAGIDSVQIGAYTGGKLGALNVRGGASYSFDSIDVSRGVFFPGFSDQTRASFHGNVGQVFGEIGYGMAFGHVAVEPLAGLAYVHVRDGAFQESGGAAVLSGASAHENIGYSFLGFRAATVLPLANGTALVPRASVQWQYAFGDVTPVAGLAFQGTGTAFSVAGVPIARNTAFIETGFDWRFSPQARLGAFYQGELAAHAQTHAFKGVINWQF